MPEPDFVDYAYDPFESPREAIEIIGRGEESRRSKTFLKDQLQAWITHKISHHKKTLLELFRTQHAKHYTKEIELEGKNGELIVKRVPEVLSDREVEARYPAVALWRQYHEEAVGHYPSLEGRSITAATGREESRLPSRDDDSKRRESSAGTDRGKRWE